MMFMDIVVSLQDETSHPHPKEILLKKCRAIYHYSVQYTRLSLVYGRI